MLFKRGSYVAGWDTVILPPDPFDATMQAFEGLALCTMGSGRAMGLVCEPKMARTRGRIRRVGCWSDNPRKC